MWSWVAIAGFASLLGGIYLQWGLGPALMVAGALALGAGVRGERSAADHDRASPASKPRVVEVDVLQGERRAAGTTLGDGWLARLRKRG